jgi:orotidine-5'-phosphate decarboxylase
MERTALVSALRTEPAAHRIITALDVPGAAAALALAARLGPQARYVKVGLELFSAAGPQVVKDLQAAGRRVFLDLKYHDIPNTVGAAARVAADLGAAFCTVHASAGRRAMTAAAEALAAAPAGPDGRRPALLGVTVLTSFAPEELAEIALSPESLGERVVRLARLAWDSGCDGLVCAPVDLPLLRAELGAGPVIVPPGIRPAGAAGDDQSRVATAADAVAAGADFLVVGRPIARADDPAAALATLAREISTAASR